MFGSRGLGRSLARFRRRPASDYQSPHNPTQYDRLPEGTRPELALPETGDPEAAKRASLRAFAWACGFGLLAAAGAAGCSAGAGLNAGPAAVTAAAVLLVAGCRLRSRGFWWTPLAVLAAAATFAGLAAWGWRFGPAVVAAGLTAYFADRFAGQAVHFQSRLPTAYGLSRIYRETWRDRFRKPAAQLRGETYPALLAATTAAALGGLAWAGAGEEPAFRLLVAAASVASLSAVAVVLAERAAARLARRPPAKPGEVWRGLVRAVRSWLLVGRTGNPAPGLYRAPTGGCASRRVELFGVLLAGVGAAAACVPVTERAAMRIGPSAVAAQRSELRPYQRTMLARMAPAERGRWEDRLRTDPVAAATSVAAGSSGGRVWALSAACLAAVPAGLAFTLAPALACAAGVASRPWPPRTRPGRFLDPHVWEDAVGALRRSKDRTERESLFFGVNAFDNSPVLVPRSVVGEHVHLTGGTGTGKTSVGIMSLMTQLIRRGDCSVVVIDLKGDDAALFETARVESEKTGAWFRWVTTTRGRSTYVFNPLDQAYFRDRTPSEKADLITEAAGLQYGTTYGPSYFTVTNYEALTAAVEHYERDRPLRSFRELERALREDSGGSLSRKQREDAAAARGVVSQLADPNGLNAVPGDDTPPGALARSVDCASLFRSPQTLYLNLASGDGAAVARGTGVLTLHAIFQSAAQLRSGRRVPVYVFIDEFQRLASPNLEVILQQGRSMDVGLILSHQSMSDLDLGGGVDVRATVANNTAIKQTFSVGDVAEARELSEGSGGQVFLGRSWQSRSDARGDSVGTSWNETAAPRLSINDLMMMGDRPGRSLFQLRRGAGYAQYGGFPVLIDSCHVITEAEFRRRKAAPWPELSDETIPAGRRRFRRPPLGPEDGYGGDDLFADPTDGGPDRPPGGGSGGAPPAEEREPSAEVTPADRPDDPPDDDAEGPAVPETDDAGGEPPDDAAATGGGLESLTGDPADPRDEPDPDEPERN